MVVKLCGRVLRLKLSVHWEALIGRMQLRVTKNEQPRSYYLRGCFSKRQSILLVASAFNFCHHFCEDTASHFNKLFHASIKQEVNTFDPANGTRNLRT